MQNPTINGRYQILQQIGVGGFGLTYLAEDLQLQTRPKCVVKHLRPQITDAETLNLANRLFQQEAEILYRLGGHPNIPSLIAHFKERGEFFLVQEFIEGHTIDREFTGGKKYNQKEIIQFLGQTLEILSFVHSQNVIHRDIKPTNLIRRGSDGNIFLIDFGAVKQVGAATAPTPNGNTFSTITVGSHGYMPMEHMAGNPNFASDLYALGLVAIEALTGIKPLDLPKHGMTNEFMWSHKAQLSPDLERFISKLVRLDFRQRYTSGTEALNALNSIAANAGFFQNRPQAPVMATIQPIASNQNFQPAPVPQMSNPSFVPPTIIVPAQGFPSQPPPRSFHGKPPAAPQKSSGTAILLTVLGIVVFVGFLFVAGKILNFRWSSLKEDPEVSSQSRSSSKKNMEASSNVSLYDEAEKQAKEAAEIERMATTKFEWEQIGSKYRRASALLSSIEDSNPLYSEAQGRIKDYTEKAVKAEARAQNFQNGTTSASPTPQPAGYSTAPPANPSSAPAPARIKLTMPGKLSAKTYIAYNYDDGYNVSKNVFTDDDSNFSSRVEDDSYYTKNAETVKISFQGGSINFRPPMSSGRLKPGSYNAIRLNPSEPSGNYAMSFDRFYCYQGTSYQFTVNGIMYDDLYQGVSYFDATFVMSCNGQKLMGRVHYDSR